MQTISNVQSANALSSPAGTPDKLLRSLDKLATTKSRPARQEVSREGQPASTWYRIVSGAAFAFVIKADGRRQIVDLLFPGDFVGFTSSAEYDHTVETAAGGAVVACYLRKSVELAVDTDPRLAQIIRRIDYERLGRLQQQVLILSRIRVQEKVASFILAMADRLSDGRSNCFTLPLSRYEMADYLAISAETVSRTLSDFRKRGMIRLAGMRTIQIVNRGALEDGDETEQSNLSEAAA